MNNKKKLIIDYIVILLLSVLIFIFTTLFIIRLTILNKDYVKNNINNNYYDKVYIEIKRNMKNSMLSIHIDNKVLDNIYTESDIEDSVNNTLEILYDDYKNEIDTTNVERKLRNSINNYYKENNVVDINSDGVDEFVNTMMECYKQEFNIMNNINSIGKTLQNIRTIIDIILMLTFIILVALLIYLRKEIIKYFITPLFTYSLLTIFIVIYINSRIIIKYITIVSNSFSVIIRELLSNILNIFILVSIIYIVLGILLVIIDELLKNKSKGNKKRKNTTKKKKTTKKKTSTKKKTKKKSSK